MANRSNVNDGVIEKVLLLIRSSRLLVGFVWNCANVAIWRRKNRNEETSQQTEISCHNSTDHQRRRERNLRTLFFMVRIDKKMEWNETKRNEMTSTDRQKRNETVCGDIYCFCVFAFSCFGSIKMSRPKRKMPSKKNKFNQEDNNVINANRKLSIDIHDESAHHQSSRHLIRFCFIQRRAGEKKRWVFVSLCVNNIKQ